MATPLNDVAIIIAKLIYGFFKISSARSSRRTANVTEEDDKDVLVFWKDLPKWQQNNEFIISGYRPASGSVRKSLKSLTNIHNETVNIYTHIIGSFIFFILPYLLYDALYPRYPKASIADIVVFSTFFFGVAICFLFSAIYHTIANHSARVQRIGLQFDLLGIVILMWGSTIPTIYYGFPDSTGLRVLYWAMVTALSGSCAIVTMKPYYRQPSMRGFRSCMYSGLGISAVIPIAHGIICNGLEVQNKRMSLGWMGVMGGLNILGAAAYTSRVPERLFPIRYDIYGSSHQILHVAVVLAGLAHMCGLLQAFDYFHRSDVAMEVIS